MEQQNTIKIDLPGAFSVILSHSDAELIRTQIDRRLGKPIDRVSADPRLPKTVEECRLVLSARAGDKWFMTIDGKPYKLIGDMINKNDANTFSNCVRPVQLGATAVMMQVADALNDEENYQPAEDRVAAYISWDYKSELPFVRLVNPSTESRGSVYFKNKDLAEKAIRILGHDIIATASGQKEKSVLDYSKMGV